MLLNEKYKLEEKSQGKIEEIGMKKTENTEVELKQVEEKKADTAMQDVCEIDEKMKVDNERPNKDPHTCLLAHKPPTFPCLLYPSVSEMSGFFSFFLSEPELGVTGSRV